MPSEERATRRGLILLGITVGIVVCGLVLGSWLSLNALSGVNRSIVTVVLAIDLALLAFRVFAVVDAVRCAFPLLVAALVALTAVPHVAAGWMTVRGYNVLESVFADEEPCGTACDRGAVLLSQVVAPLPQWVKDAWEWALVERLGPGEVAPLDSDVRVLADAKPATSKPWTTILLLGTDEGPGNLGGAHRHDHPRRDPARHWPRDGLRDPAQPGPSAARAEAEAIPRAVECALRPLRRRRGGSQGREAGRLEPARDPGRLLRARQPARVRRPRRRARRRREPRQGAAAG